MVVQGSRGDIFKIRRKVMKKVRGWSVMALCAVVACCIALDADAGQYKGAGKTPARTRSRKEQRTKGKGFFGSLFNTGGNTVKKVTKDVSDGEITQGTVSSTTSHVKNTVKKIFK